MRPSLALFLLQTTVALAQTRSSKRGLVSVATKHNEQDDRIWVQGGSDLTWYYNYQAMPVSAYATTSADKPATELEFVPMLWGAIDDTSFLDAVTRLSDGGGSVKHVLGFNEPDGPKSTGGSDIDPKKAAEVWLKNIEPLREKGIRVGLPACTGGEGGLPWLQQFLAECSKLISKGSETRNCSYDFVAIHWYGNFEGLASHLGTYSAAFPNTSQWITEFAFDHQDLEATQSFFNMSLEYFDRLDNVERYSYFGSFRSAESNVGPDAVMLNNDGQLTDIGSWYLGGAATGVDPRSGHDSAGVRTQSSMLSLLALVVAGALMLS
ncbi:glycoside hydrolase family 128 protein [Xylariaceae sp. FL0594]|nr:glycoside hydrolase family 128 protein [Xylariaceae sp. FL0594]